MKQHKNVRLYGAKDHKFEATCKKVGIQPTRRQYKKWQAGRGLARQHQKSPRFTSYR